jgi:hypothetical protein
MTSKSRNYLLVYVTAFPLACAGFFAGWLASRHLVVSPEKEELANSIPVCGDAPENVRRGVLQTLRGFQDGYIRRDVGDLARFMAQYFAPSGDNLVLGTDPGEWIHGHELIERFIRNDWQYWGDVRLDVDACQISAAGDAAWLATRGSVSFHGSPRLIRFTASLVRKDGRWMFRQVQFQWDASSGRLTLSELFRPSSLLRLRWR